jgi:DNA-binding Lrp family transcriptional regulator/predicted O-methyltransferase YrrM
MTGLHKYINPPDRSGRTVVMEGHMGEDKGTAAAPPPQAQLAQLINGYWISYSVIAAARLGLADALDDGAATPVARLAERVGAQPDALYRLMRALASAGIFREEGARAFAHTPLSSALKKDVPGSMHGLATMTSLLHLRAWPELLHSVRTGETAFAKVFGHDVFDDLPTDPEAARAFDAAMAGYTTAMSQAVVARYDFDGFERIVDVGGGSGVLLSSILGKFARPRGVTFDLPHVTDRARATIDRAGLGDRAEAVGGDFFASVPAGDCYTMKMILHDWDDDKSRAILRTLRRSIAPAGKLCVIEAVVPPGNTPSPVKFLDINMLVMTGGRERTADEYAALFAASGFRLARIVPCGAADVIEADPA